MQSMIFKGGFGASLNPCLLYTSTIAAVLGAKDKKDGFLTGSGYIVSWCVGHLVGLSEAAAYGEQYKKWSYEMCIRDRFVIPLISAKEVTFHH